MPLFDKGPALAENAAVGGDGDTPGIAQDITLDDIRAVAFSDEPLETRREELKRIREALQAREPGDRGHEFDVLGVYLSAHPLDGYAAALAERGVVAAAQVLEAPGRFDGATAELAGVIVARKEKRTERSRFAFLQVSDISAQFEVMLFADVLERSRDLLEIGTAVLITADIRADGDEIKFAAQRLTRLDDVAAGRGELVEIELSEAGAAGRLRPHLREGEKGAQVRLVLGLPNGREVVVALPAAISLSHARRPDVERIAGVTRIAACGSAANAHEPAARGTFH